MAKKPKKEAAGESAGEGAAHEGGGGKKKLIMIVAAVLVLGGAGGGGFWWFKLRKPADEQSEQAKVAAKKPVAFIDMREMTINLALSPGQERQSMMKVKVALEVSDPKLSNDIQPLVPRIEDAFQTFMRELRPTDLEGSAGVYRLKEELLRRVNVAVYPARVDAVLFKDILVQ
jgi:flagellar FliL protein